MSDFVGMEDLLEDFLQEASDMLSDVDNKLVDLEKSPDDHTLLNDIFRGFHTIKGGAGFLNAHELVTLCHLTENLFDRLRNKELYLTPSLMDVILAATKSVRDMFGELSQHIQPSAADVFVLKALNDVLENNEILHSTNTIEKKLESNQSFSNEPNWENLHSSIKFIDIPSVNKSIVESTNIKKEQNIVVEQEEDKIKPIEKKRSNSRRVESSTRESTIRVDTVRLDQVLNLSGEIGLTKNRLTSLRVDILSGKNDPETLQALDQAVSQLDLLVSDLQNSVMKTRMQPIGRLFQKYPRIARDLARQLGKDVELVLAGEETEIDKTMIEDLADPLIHLIRNAVDHGVEMPSERLSMGKPEKSLIRLEARQEGDHILLLIADDGKGMNPERIRSKAIEKGLISEDEANVMDERQSLNLIFLPGFSTKSEISDVSGRGVGMDVVKTNIQKLNGSIEIKSEEGNGSVFIISLPLTLAILPVLLVLLDNKPFAIPLSMVREIMTIDANQIQSVAGKQTMVVRGEVLPILNLSDLLGWEKKEKVGYGVLMQSAEKSFILGVDSFAGRDDAVIKSLEDFRPRGVAGVTTLSNGQIVLILDMKELLDDFKQSLS